MYDPVARRFTAEQVLADGGSGLSVRGARPAASGRGAAGSPDRAARWVAAMRLR